MSTYQELKGLKVKYLSADTSGDRKIEGEVFYNSTDFKLKSFVATQAWHSGGNMTNSRAYHGSAGSVTAGLVFGGSTPPYPSPTTLTEEYNGTGFNVGGAMNVAMAGLNGSGTQTAALAFGGFKPPSNTT